MAGTECSSWESDMVKCELCGDNCDLNSELFRLTCRFCSKGLSKRVDEFEALLQEFVDRAALLGIRAKPTINTKPIRPEDL